MKHFSGGASTGSSTPRGYNIAEALHGNAGVSLKFRRLATEFSWSINHLRWISGLVF